MIDTLAVGQKVKFKLANHLYRGQVVALDLQNDCLHVERDKGSPRRIVCSFPMVAEVWDVWNERWVTFRLPTEEAADMVQAVLEQNMNKKETKYV